MRRRTLLALFPLLLLGAAPATKPDAAKKQLALELTFMEHESRQNVVQEKLVLSLNRGKIAALRLEKTALQERRPAALTSFKLFPAKHFITPKQKLTLAVANIRQELKARLATTLSRSASPWVPLSSSDSLMIRPGDSVLTQMPCSPSSRDNVRVKVAIAPLDDE